MPSCSLTMIKPLCKAGMSNVLRNHFYYCTMDESLLFNSYCCQSVSCIMFAACLQGYLVLRLDWSHFIHDMPAHSKLDVSRRHTGCFDLICCSFVHPIILGITVQHHTNEKPKTCILTVTANNGMCFCTAMLEHLEQIFGHQKCQLPWRGWPFLCSILGNAVTMARSNPSCTTAIEEAALKETGHRE